MRGIHAAGGERHGDRVAGGVRGLFDCGIAAQHDQVGQRDLLATGLACIEVGLDTLQRGQHLGQLRRLVGGPVLLRGQTNARTIGTAALVRATEAGRRGPGSGNQLRNAQAGAQHGLLERGSVLRIDQRMV